MSISGAKPFSLQAPEAIAKQYQGNKQKIAQAIQLGLVDATAGTLAGMFIDRMRAAAMQEQGPPQTVAQQVLGSSPPAPPPGGPPMQPQMGGAPPPPMPMAQGAPPASSAAPMGGPPVRAADGGLMSIPIPDTMFDEPANGSYGNGGLVAFAGSGSTNVALDAASRDDEDPEGYIPFEASGFGELLGLGPKSKARRADLKAKEEAVRERTARDTQRGRALHQNLLAEGFGGQTVAVPETYKIAPKPAQKLASAVNAPAGIPDIRVDGTPKPKEGERFIGRDGRVYTQQTAKPAEAPSAPRTDAPRTGGGLASLASSKPDKAAADKAAATPPTTPTTVAEDLKMIQGLMQDPETKAYMDGQTERLAKQKKEDVWSTLAQIGFGMAASKSPTLLGAIGEAGTAALPTAQKALQARRAAEADFAKQRMEQRGRDVTTALGYNQNAEQVGLKREEMAQKERQFEAEIDSAWKRAQLQAGAQIRGAQISAAASAERETDFKFAVRSMANSLYNNDRKTYPTYEAALATAIKEYVGDIHPQQAGVGPSLAEALNDTSKQRPAMPSGKWSATPLN